MNAPHLSIEEMPARVLRKFRSGMDTHAIAVLTDTPEATVERWLHQAFDRLKHTNPEAK